jgi:hypothetical protein
MVCFDLRLCGTMAFLDITDEEYPILVCSNCLGRPITLEDRVFRRRTVQDRIYRRVTAVYNRERKYYDPPSTRLDLEQHVLRTSTVEDDVQVWIDGYSGQVSLEDAVFPSEFKIGPQVVNCHPCGLSLEKVNQFWLRKDGNLSLHEPENVILTKDCINRCKSDLPVSILALLKRAVELRKAVEGQPPRRGYANVLAIEWKAFERVSVAYYCRLMDGY